jgi:hypothetical protein
MATPHTTDAALARASSSRLSGGRPAPRPSRRQRTRCRSTPPARAYAASPAIAAGGALSAIPDAERASEQRARHQPGADALRRLARPTAQTRRRNRIRPRGPAADRLGLPHCEITAAAEVTHATVRAIVTRREGPRPTNPTRRRLDQRSPSPTAIDQGAPAASPQRRPGSGLSAACRHSSNPKRPARQRRLRRALGSHPGVVARAGRCRHVPQLRCLGRSNLSGR